MSALDTTPIIPAARAYWTTAELAERFGVDVDTIYELASTGGLPHVRFGRAYRFPIDSVLEWERQRTIANDGSAAANKPRPRPVRPRPAGSSRPKGARGFTPQPYAGPLGKRRAA
jgi:excisionase family DNA binding protein